MRNSPLTKLFVATATVAAGILPSLAVRERYA